MGNLRNDVMVALRKSWDTQTCYPKCRDQWSSDNPAFGQCAVTALVIQDYFGGIIKFSSLNNHFFNEIGGEIIDYTDGQFSSVINIDDAIEWTRRRILFGERAERAETLWRYGRLLFCFSRVYKELTP